MANIPDRNNHRWALLVVVLWAVVSSLSSMIVVFSVFALAGLVLYESPWRPVPIGALFCCPAAFILGGLWLGVAFRAIVRSTAAAWQFPGYPDRHWRDVTRVLGWYICIDVVLIAAGSSLTVLEILAPGQPSKGGPSLAVILDALCILFQLQLVGDGNDILRHGSVMPYFPQEVGELDTFCHGKSLARRIIELDQAAGSLGVTPLSSFGWNDDMKGEPLVWHDPANGLKTAIALLSFLRGEVDWSDRHEVIADLERLVHALTRANAHKIMFSLLLRHWNATNAMEWEVRKGTCF